MSNQRDVFAQSEGNAWLNRNRYKVPIEKDLVLAAFDCLVGGLNEQSRVLEIGCSNGWRLEAIREKYGCTKLYGVDPSKEAVKEAHQQGIIAYPGDASDLHYNFGEVDFDVVIYGFCLYLCDRTDLFQIAKEGDRVLADGGLMAIYDFNPLMPHKNKYHHKEGLWSYKQNYDQMFLWNPAYTRLTTIYHQDGQTKASLLRKTLERGWPSASGS